VLFHIVSYNHIFIIKIFFKLNHVDFTVKLRKFFHFISTQKLRIITDFSIIFCCFTFSFVAN